MKYACRLQLFVIAFYTPFDFNCFHLTRSVAARFGLVRLRFFLSVNQFLGFHILGFLSCWGVGNRFERASWHFTESTVNPCFSSFPSLIEVGVWICGFYFISFESFLHLFVSPSNSRQKWVYG